MTVSGIGNHGESLQAIRAQNAFQRNAKISEQAQKTAQIPEEQEIKISISSKAIEQANNTDNEVKQRKVNPYVGEIKSFADKYNMEDVEEEDIEEALKYGTSLFANYTA